MKWGSVKQARQQAARMEKKGYWSDALKLFMRTEQLLKAYMPRGKQRSELMERNAKQFLESGFARESDIKKQMSEDIGEGSPERAAAYADAENRLKAEMEARHFVGSDAIQQIAELQEAQGLSTKDFYSMLRETAMQVYVNRAMSPDQISSFIVELGNKYGE